MKQCREALGLMYFEIVFMGSIGRDPVRGTSCYQVRKCRFV